MGNKTKMHNTVVNAAILSAMAWNLNKTIASKLHRNIEPDMPPLRVPVPGTPFIKVSYDNPRVQGIHPNKGVPSSK
jgi:hypothetical protein